MDTKYTPINCDLYDFLEEAATLKKAVTLTIKEDNGAINQLVGVIKTFTAHNGVEHLIMEDATRLRLDKITHLNGEPFINNHC